MAVLFVSRVSGGVVVVSCLPLPVRCFLSSEVVGFSGSRSVVPSVLAVACGFVPSGASVFVGCARGVDSAVRSSFPSALVFSVARFGSGRPAFARRSVAFVRALSASGGVLVSFPGRPCPSGLAPSSSSRACFCGLGSGSWASLAFALGLGVPVVVWLPRGVVPPASFGLCSVGSGWWVSLPF